MKYRAKHIFEYSALRSISFLAQSLPYSSALTLGRGIGATLYKTRHKRILESEQRIQDVLQCSKTAAQEISKKALINLGMNVIEMLRPNQVNAAFLAQHYDSGGVLDIIAELQKNHKGVIVALPHMGNWEMSCPAASQSGLPIFSLAAKQRNPLINLWFERLRIQSKVEILERNSRAPRTIIRYLKEGRLLAILTDLRSRLPGVQVDFLGGKANLYPGMGAFARQCNVPILPVLVRRENQTNHSWICSKPIFPNLEMNKAEDILRMTQETMDYFDQGIRQTPEQYFWFNKRWVLEPLEEDG